MLYNECLLAKIGSDTAENKQTLQIVNNKKTLFFAQNLQWTAIARTGTVGSTSHTPKDDGRKATRWWLRAAGLPEWRPSPPVGCIRWAGCFWHWTDLQAPGNASAFWSFELLTTFNSCLVFVLGVFGKSSMLDASENHTNNYAWYING